MDIIRQYQWVCVLACKRTWLWINLLPITIHRIRNSQAKVDCLKTHCELSFQWYHSFIMNWKQIHLVCTISVKCSINTRKCSLNAMVLIALGTLRLVKGPSKSQWPIECKRGKDVLVTSLKIVYYVAVHYEQSNIIAVFGDYGVSLVFYK